MAFGSRPEATTPRSKWKFPLICSANAWATAKCVCSFYDSRALNDVSGPCLIMAGAGMCTGGRILHHFRHNLALPGTAVLFVGYQGHGSLGRMIVDGIKSVTIFGEKIPVRASVHTFGGLSGHATFFSRLHHFVLTSMS
ncbi:MAG TPA: hypothetical protein VG055_21040 [Planctomycetaceae bacterium]|nr:hypothetical protein [Planctomycetaceae bacterium]